jgi:hypothetical protein
MLGCTFTDALLMRRTGPPPPPLTRRDLPAHGRPRRPLSSRIRRLRLSDKIERSRFSIKRLVACTCMYLHVPAYFGVKTARVGPFWAGQGKDALTLPSPVIRERVGAIPRLQRREPAGEGADWDTRRARENPPEGDWLTGMKPAGETPARATDPSPLRFDATRTVALPILNGAGRQPAPCQRTFPCGIWATIPLFCGNANIFVAMPVFCAMMGECKLA